MVLTMLEGDETVNLRISDTHIYRCDYCNAESVDPTQNATLTITGVGAGTVGLDNALTVAATDATGGSAISGT